VPLPLTSLHMVTSMSSTPSRATEPRSPPCASTPLNTCSSTHVYAGSWPLTRAHRLSSAPRVSMSAWHTLVWPQESCTHSPTHVHTGAWPRSLSSTHSREPWSRHFSRLSLFKCAKTQRATCLHDDGVPLTRKPRPPCTCPPTAVSHVQTTLTLTPTPTLTLTACDAR
jgi:hypothetical protein